MAGILAVSSASKQEAIATWEGDKKSVSRSENGMGGKDVNLEPICLVHT